jgi:Protein of unknown function (DUF2878)
LLKTILSIVGFQIVWFACAYGAASEIWYLPCIAGLLYVSCIYIWSPDKKGLTLFILACLLLGFLVDTILLQHSFVVFKNLNSYPFNLYQPWWMTILWAAFASSFGASFSWLKKKYLLVAVLGGIFGPIAYYSGSQFGAIEPISSLGLFLVGILWLISMPIMLKLSFRFNSFHQPETILPH